MPLPEEQGSALSDTIFALSSGSARSGIAVVRICGPAAGEALDRLAPPRGKPRFAAYRRVRDPATREVLDEAIALWFPGPRTETGEDMAELHVHGSPAVVRSVLAALARIPGCRPAGPGEFARRAFDNGKLDLTAVEGLADLIDAQTDAQRRQALRQMQGGLSNRYEGWRAALIEARALVEAGIDFSDEGDVAETAIAAGLEKAGAIAADITRHLSDGRRGELIRDGFRVVIAGPPNVGKSSLMNALAQRDVAIVSDEPGTTRDVLEVHLDLGGYPAIVTDTAGLREAGGAVEKEGMRRALERADRADLLLWIVDPAEPVPQPAARPGGKDSDVLRVLNKTDTPAGAASMIDGAWDACVSARTGAGLDQLTSAISGRIAARIATGSSEGDEAPITQARHRQALESCLEHLQAAHRPDLFEAELAAEHLRLAAADLGRIVGVIDPEHVLGQIFSRFCIGK